MPALYKYTAYKVAVLLKRQPRSVQIGALTLVCLTLIGGITLAYASLFTARPAGSQATSQQKTGEAGKLKNVSMPTTTKSTETTFADSISTYLKNSQDLLWKIPQI